MHLFFTWWQLLIIGQWSTCQKLARSIYDGDACISNGEDFFFSVVHSSDVQWDVHLKLHVNVHTKRIRFVLPSWQYSLQEKWPTDLNLHIAKTLSFGALLLKYGWTAETKAITMLKWFCDLWCFTHYPLLVIPHILRILKLAKNLGLCVF